MAGTFNEISEITPFLYLSGCGFGEFAISQIGIKLILNVTTEIDIINAGKDVETLKFLLRDRPEENIFVHFERVTKLIHEARLNNKKVLVHCVAGVSRSASMCIAYLMRYENMELGEALDFVHKRRNIIRPNMGFMAQLRRYNDQLQYDRKVPSKKA